MTLVEPLAPGETRDADVDPRVTRSRAAILKAAAELLIEGGASGVTIEGIAERSGVAKTTIYRHWESRSRLVFDAFESLFQHPAQVETEGTLKGQLEVWLNQLIRGLTQSSWAPAATALIDAADRDEEMRQLLHDFLLVRMADARKLLREAAENSELRPGLDVDVAVSALAGPVFYRRLVSRETLDGEFVVSVVAEFLEGATAGR